MPRVRSSSTSISLGYRSEGIASRLEDVAADEYGEAIAEGIYPSCSSPCTTARKLRAGIHQLPGEGFSALVAIRGGS